MCFIARKCSLQFPCMLWSRGVKVREFSYTVGCKLNVLHCAKHDGNKAAEITSSSQSRKVIANGESKRKNYRS
jgi:hypothetical protein